MIGADLLTQMLKTMLNTFLSPQMLRILVPVLALAVVVWVCKQPIVKGWIGEAAVNLGLRLHLDKRHYHLLKNVTLPCDDGKTTQIDHVVVSVFGIFVIETKNMKGWIFGSEREATWTQKFHRWSKQFQNPLRQNYKHVAVLSERLGLPAEKFKSVIMFIGDAKLKTEMPPNVLDRGLTRFIVSHRDAILTEEQVQAVLEAVAEKRLAAGLRTHVTHVRNVKAIVAAKTAVHRPTAPPVALPVVQAPPVPVAAAPAAVVPACPNCGRTMVPKVARTGPRAGKGFWGCPDFPRCRGIVNKG